LKNALKVFTVQIAKLNGPPLFCIVQDYCTIGVFVLELDFNE